MIAFFAHAPLPMIFLSLPKRPDGYPRRPFWQYQLSHFVFRGLVRRFGSHAVTFVDWQEGIAPKASDVLVTSLSNRNYTAGSRIVGLENDTLIPEHWSSPVFEKFGMAAPIDDIRWAWPQLANAVGFCVLSNDTALGKLAAGDPGTVSHVEHFRALVSGNYRVQPHPIDKTLFTRFFKQRLNRPTWRSKHRMMVYHNGWRKNSAQTIALLKEMGFREGREFEVVSKVHKERAGAMRRISSRYNIVFSGSFSESGPINMLEYLTQGFIVAGHENWWNGYGLPQSVWSYDPTRADEMRARLAYLLDPANLPELQDHRDRIVEDYNSRHDNEWDYFCDNLADVIRTALKA